jgi:hypothetical protein
MDRTLAIASAALVGIERAARCPAEHAARGPQLCDTGPAPGLRSRDLQHTDSPSDATNLKRQRLGPTQEARLAYFLQMSVTVIAGTGGETELSSTDPTAMAWSFPRATSKIIGTG